MTTPTTELQQSNQAEDAQASWSAAQPTTLQPDQGGTVPTFYQSDELLDAQKYAGGIEPPSQGEIHKQMWIGSFMMALMAGLASGNASAAIVGGMWGAIGIHDYGNTLRQRAEYVPQLKKDGYTMPAILKWYEDGDQGELDKERGAMQQRDQMEQNAEQFDERQSQQNDQFDRRMNQQGDEFERRMNQQSGEFARRMADMEYHEGAMERIAERQGQKSDLQERRQLYTEVKKGLEPEQTKLYYMGMANKSLKNLEDAVSGGDKAKAAGAYSQYRDNYARALLGGGATLNEHDMEGATGLPDWKGQMEQNASLFTSGLPSDDWLKAQREAVNNETKNAHSNLLHQGHQIYESQIQQGATPDQAMKYVTGAMQGTAIGNNDWSKDEGEQEPPKPTTQQVDDVMAKYGHHKK